MTLRRKCTGAKHTTEAAEYDFVILVGERSMQEEDRSQGLLDSMEVIMPV